MGKNWEKSCADRHPCPEKIVGKELRNVGLLDCFGFKKLLEKMWLSIEVFSDALNWSKIGLISLIREGLLREFIEKKLFFKNWEKIGKKLGKNWEKIGKKLGKNWEKIGKKLGFGAGKSRLKKGRKN